MPFIGLKRPPQQVVQAALKEGDLAPSAPWRRAGQAELVCFLRHTGCPFAEAVLKALSELAERQPELKCVAVLHGDEAIASQWSDSFDLSPALHIVVDETREIHGEWGVGYGAAGKLFHPAVLPALLRLALKGIRNRDASGTRWQQQECFMLDQEGHVVWHHVPAHVGDLPNFRQLPGL